MSSLSFHLIEYYVYFFYNSATDNRTLEKLNWRNEQSLIIIVIMHKGLAFWSLTFLNNLMWPYILREWRNFLRLNQWKLLGICTILGGNKLFPPCSVSQTLVFTPYYKTWWQHSTSWQCDLSFLSWFHTKQALSLHSIFLHFSSLSSWP